MKQLLILSGKGGTGKTTVASAFIRLLQAKAYADCDVDAPNLHLVLRQDTPPQSKDFFGLPVAVINPEQCQSCGLCETYCRFGAVHSNAGVYSVNSFACEGCGVCTAFCPAEAITLQPDAAGELMLFLNNESVFSTAQLNMGKGTSGLLVTEVKNRMKKAASPEANIAIIDGSPGIGCPVIASLAGVDMALIVAEPSVSGISDMERIIKTARHFGVEIVVCVNKYDTNLKKTEDIQEFCANEGIAFAGVIPYDKQAVAAINQGISIADTKCPSGTAVKAIFEKTVALLEG